MTKNFVREDAVVVYDHKEIVTETVVYNNYSDILNKSYYLTNGNEYLYRVKGTYREKKYVPIYNRELKDLEYLTEITNISRTDEKIIVKFSQRNFKVNQDKRYGRKLQQIRYLTFNLKNNNVYHSTQVFVNRKWKCQVRVNQFALAHRKDRGLYFGDNIFLEDFIVSLVLHLGLDLEKYIEKTRDVALLDEICMDWYLMRNGINYDLHNRYLLVNFRPPKRYLAKYSTFSEAFIKYYKISDADLLTRLFNESFHIGFNPVNLAFLSNLMPYEVYRALRHSSFDLKNRITRRTCNLKRDSFTIDEWSIIRDMMAYGHHLETILRHLELYLLGVKDLGLRLKFSSFNELRGVLNFYAEKMLQRKIIKQLL